MALGVGYTGSPERFSSGAGLLGRGWGVGGGGGKATLCVPRGMAVPERGGQWRLREMPKEAMQGFVRPSQELHCQRRSGVREGPGALE